MIKNLFPKLGRYTSNLGVEKCTAFSAVSNHSRAVVLRKSCYRMVKLKLQNIVSTGQYRILDIL